MELKFLDSTGLGVLWAKIKSTFALASHKHTKSDISDFPTNVSEFTNDAGYVTKTAADEAYAPKTHTHNSADITVSGSTQKLDGPLNNALDKLASDSASQDALVQKSLKSATISLSEKKVTLTTAANDGTPGTSTFDLPTSAAGMDGLISHETVKKLAGEVAGSVYKVKGTKATIDNVLAVEAAAVGDVYNVTAEFTLNGQKYPAGTNVVFVGPAEEGEPDPSDQAQWDALGGTVDLTPYAKTEYVSSTYATKSDLESAKGDLTSHTGDAAIHLPGGGSAGQVLKKTEGGSEWAAEYRYTLPAASGSLGGVKTGGDVTISDGVISISNLPDSLIKAMTKEEIEGILV